MSSMATLVGEQVSVFADTNLGTRIALNVPQDITAGAFKRDFERVHFLCLPNSGKIQVNELMVKRKLFFYHVPNSLPLKYVFDGMGTTWFLHVEASKARDSSEDNTVDILNEKKKRRKFNKKHLQNAASAMPEGCSCKIVETQTGINNKSPVVMSENEVQMSVKLKANSTHGSPGEMSKEVLSVTGIIDRYFPTDNRLDSFSSPSHSDVTSRAVYEEVDNQPKSKTLEITHSNVLRAPLLHVESISRTSQDTRRESKLRKRAPLLHIDSVSGTLRDKRRESKLRKRLLTASQSLGLSPNKQSPTLSLCRFRDEKLSLHKSQTIGSLFDISDNDD